MKWNVIIVSTTILLCLSSVSNGQLPDIDDFVPPLQQGLSEPKNKVTEQDNLIVSKTMQDGLAYADNKFKLNKVGDGCHTVVTKTGMGTICSATADYKVYKNPTATQLSKRQALARAFFEARKLLLTGMSGVRSDCERAGKSNLSAIVTGEETKANVTRNWQETCAQVVEGVLPAYVTWDVEDNVADKIVRISVASSTKTRTAIKRVGGTSVIIAPNPGVAWKTLLAEIAHNVTPPLGARLITVPETGQNIVVGFGSSVVLQNENQSVARAMRKVAWKQSRIRAENALVSFLNGDNLYWNGGFNEDQFEGSEQWELHIPEDGTPAVTKVFDETQESFLYKMKDTEVYAEITGGMLPPGVKSETFESPDGYWAYAIAVYSPTFTALAEQAGAQSQAAAGKLDSYQEVKKQSKEKWKKDKLEQKSKRKLKLLGGVVDEGGYNPQLMSGQVSDEADF